MYPLARSLVEGDKLVGSWLYQVVRGYIDQQSVRGISEVGG